MPLKKISDYKYLSPILGGLIYMTGDTIAALIIDQFSWIRLLGIFALGATLYSFEIPRYFKWIEKVISGYQGWKKIALKTSMALLYFNPLWIARHLMFVYLISGKMDMISWDLLRIGFLSFAVNIPVSILANYLIQNKISLKYRFFASAIFSGVMAIYYSMSSVWF
ncbi:MAG: hypothetical protein IPI60_11690 [Saprospiraceae bacterium]|nr:hypothetical protein [Saprospiraceae bacterium]